MNSIPFNVELIEFKFFKQTDYVLENIKIFVYSKKN